MHQNLLKCVISDFSVNEIEFGKELEELFGTPSPAAFAGVDVGSVSNQG